MKFARSFSVSLVFAALLAPAAFAAPLPEIEGTQMELRDTTVGVSGFWNWVVSHDKLGIGTTMSPDSGSSPLFEKADGTIVAEAALHIGPDPEWSQEAADAGTLKYPYARVILKFKKEGCAGAECEVDFDALGIRYLRVKQRSAGLIRISVLNSATAETGAEPFVHVAPSDTPAVAVYDLAAEECGFAGFDDEWCHGLPNWARLNIAPEGSEIRKVVRGIQWALVDEDGGDGSLAIESVEFLDSARNVVDPVLLTGIEVPEGRSALEPRLSSRAAFAAFVSGGKIVVEGVRPGEEIALYDARGSLAGSFRAESDRALLPAPAAAGLYLVRASGGVVRVLTCR